MADTRTPVAAPRQQFINIDLVRRILQCNGLNGTSRSVLLTVGMHANTERQQCFCSVGTLAHKSGWSRRTVNEHLTRLQKLGYLSLIGTHHSGTHIYQVRLDHLPADGAPTNHAPPHSHPDTTTPPCSCCTPALRQLHPPPCRSCTPPLQPLHPKKGLNKGLNNQGRKKARTTRQRPPRSLPPPSALPCLK